jgi:predicted alpha/beta-hydrolase family hydrolase
MKDILIDGNDRQPKFIFAHGAGVGMTHPFMATVAQGLAQHGIQVIRFNFPYMQRQLREGKKFPPDRGPKLIEAFEAMIPKGDRVVIGGKSMGGRIASLMADHPQVDGIACLGFPFHPPGKPERMKGDHLSACPKPCLILQGERDPFGPRDEVEAMDFSASVQLQFIPDGEHSFKPRQRSGYTESENIARAVELLSQFIWEVSGEK